jgi:intergrase/recombinase
MRLFIASDDRMMCDDELERIWKEDAMAYFRIYPGIRLEELRKITITSHRIAGDPVEVRTENLHNKNL